MSEYWVSKKKYWCTFCEIYITDDVPSRQHHENGLRHKGSKEKFVRGLYKTGEKRKRDQEDEQREMKAIDQAASAAFAHDVASGRASASSLTPTTQRLPPQPSKPSRTESKFSNYSTPESLGFVDEDAEKLAALAALRSQEGTVGAWQVVVPPPPPHPSDTLQEDDVETKPTAPPTVATNNDDDEREFKVRKRAKHPGLGEIYDPGIIAVKKKVEKTLSQGSPVGPSVVQTSISGSLETQNPTSSALPEKPKWTTVEWKKAVSTAVNTLQEPLGVGDGTEDELTVVKTDETPEPSSLAHDISHSMAEIPYTWPEEEDSKSLLKTETKELASPDGGVGETQGESLFRKRKGRPIAGSSMGGSKRK